MPPAEKFFVHLTDPGFPEPPWPGERRLGPFDTPEEAEAQAVSDIAYGGGEGIVGVYSESESERRREASHPEDVGSALAADREARPVSRGGKAHRSRSQLQPRAETARRRLEAERARQIEEDTRAFQETLPKGVSIDDLLELVKQVGQ